MRFISSLFQKAQIQGIAYTSLDAMKFFDIVYMTAVLLGCFFFPAMFWWRAFGRITFPVWFFLVGYSRSRTLSAELWLYAGLLIIVHPFIGFPIFPLNALATIIICRLVLNLCTDYNLLPNRLPELIAGCILASLVTMFFFEYGSIALLYAFLGRMVREKEARYFRPLVVASYLSFILWMEVLYIFNTAQQVYVVLGTAWVVEWLSRCPNKMIWPDWTDSGYKKIIAVLSRNTLPYYFYHRIIFQILAALLLGRSIAFALYFFN